MPRTNKSKALAASALHVAILPPVTARRRKKPDTPSLSTSLVEIRLAAGMTQEQLAADAGVGLNSLRKIEQGDIKINLSTLLKLIHFLDYDLQIIPKAKLSQGMKG